jgi:hypothetical protein
LISDELRKRGVKPGPGSRDHVLLISEWDSYYGRSLPKSMAQPLGAPDCAILSPARNRPLYCVTYMRGLDGQLPETPSAEKQNSPANGGEKGTSGDNRVDEPLARLQISKNIERPYGNGQYDYLRRLGQSIRRFDDDLSARGNGRIRAIGVVGSDVYDKLAALQILRPLFPDTVFFTTDLDARLYHPAELGWSRNLLVASAYGLELSPRMATSNSPISRLLSDLGVSRDAGHFQPPSCFEGCKRGPCFQCEPGSCFKWRNRGSSFEWRKRGSCFECGTGAARFFEW